MTRRIDRAKARAAFERAAAGGREAFGDFFLARLLGLEITYPGDACEVCAAARRCAAAAPGSCAPRRATRRAR